MLDEACEEFAVEEGQLNKRESALGDEDEELKQMQEATDNLQAKYFEENEIAESEDSARVEHIDELKSHASTLEEEYEKWSTLNKKREQYSAELRVVQEEANNKAQTLAEAEEYFRSVSKENEDGKIKLQTLTSRIAEIDRDLPKLDEEKKAAALVKNFKEAGRINSEIKLLNNQRESAQNELDKLKVTVEENETHLQEIGENKVELSQELEVLKKKEIEIKNLLLGQTEENHLE